MADTLTNGRAVALAFVVVIGASAASGFGAWIVGRPAPPPAGVATDLAPLVTELRALVETLRTREERPPTAGAPRAAAATPRVALEPEPLLQRLDRLIDVLERRGNPGRAQTTAPPQLSAADRTRPVRWDLLRALRKQTADAPKAARTSVVFSSQGEILDHFGMPTGVAYDDRNRVYVKYELTDGNDAVRFGAYFVLLDGLVVDYNFADS